MDASADNPLASGLAALSGVAETALVTTGCRAIDAGRPDPILGDLAAGALMRRLRPALATSRRRLHRRLAADRIPDALVAYVTMRSRRIDDWAREFMAEHPGATLVSLGSGLDDRFARIDDGRLRMVHVDVPEMVDLRRSLLPGRPRESAVAGSVLEQGWIAEVVARSSGAILVVAEGLLMYLAPAQVAGLLHTLRTSLRAEAVAADVLHRRWVGPLFRHAARRKMRRRLGLSAAATPRSGFRSSEELCTPGWRVAAEWSHLDDPDVRPSSLRPFRRVDWVRRVQWSVLLHGSPPYRSGRA